MNTQKTITDKNVYINEMLCITFNNLLAFLSSFDTQHRGRQEIREERGMSSLAFRTLLQCGMHLTSLLAYTSF